MSETPQEIVDRVFRENRRYTGDGLPGEPQNAPLPVGDPASGPHNPKKADMRAALLAPLSGAAAEADRAEAARDAIENGEGEFTGRALIYPDTGPEVYDASGRLIGNLGDGVEDQDAMNRRSVIALIGSTAVLTAAQPLTAAQRTQVGKNLGTPVGGLIRDFSDENGEKRRSSEDFMDLNWVEANDSPVIHVSASGAWNQQRANTGAGSMPFFYDGRFWYWHSGQDNSGVQTIGLHISNGTSLTDWSVVQSGAGTRVVNVGGGGQPDSLGLYTPSVVIHDGLFKMWYTGEDSNGSSICYATSADGLTWTKHPGNPVFERGGASEWDEKQIGLSSVIWDGSQFIMAYSGYDNSESSFSQSQIGIATSPDGITWTRQGLAIPHGGTGAWDERGCLNPVMWRDGAKYYMNYSGKPASLSLGSEIGHATSEDGINWTKAGPFLTRDMFSPRDELEYGNVVQVNGVWYLFAPAWVEGGKTSLWIGI